MNPYYQGTKAYSDGLMSTANPYRSDTVEYSQWLEGYQAEQERLTYLAESLRKALTPNTL